MKIEQAANQTMNQVMKLKIKQFTDNKLEVAQDKLMNYSTLMRESELLRIVKHINPENKNPISKKFNSPYIRDIIITDIGDETDLYKDCEGYLNFNMYRFSRLMASSGNIRNSKVVFVRKSLYDKVNDILLCGLPYDLKHDVFAKFSSYYALCSTDSIPVSLPRIVIVDDFKHSIEENFDLVKEDKNNNYNVVLDQKVKTQILPFDGAGLVDAEYIKKHWCKDLGIEIIKDGEEDKQKIPACWQFRFIPCGKGDLFTFDIKGFALEKGITEIEDLWSKKWPLFDDEGNLLVDVILTKSQFKFYKNYTDYDTWYKAFITETHGYKRTFNISGFSDAKRLTDSTVLSYQPLQTIPLSKDQCERLCFKTVNTYKEIRTDVDKFLKYRGMVNEIDEETGEIIPQEGRYLPSYYQALKANKDLFFDEYIQKKIKDDLGGFRKRSCKGMLIINGSFQTLIPDLVGLAQSAFNLPVKGVLGENQVYNQFWHSKNIKRIALCRFPHIAREWKLANVVKPNKDDVKYLDYINEGYVVNIWDSTALRMGTADFDGDHIYGITESTILNAISDLEEENKTRTILHLLPVLSEKEKKDQKPKPSYPVNDMEKLIETDCNGMQGGIGQCVNDITTLWSIEQSEQRDNYIRIMSVIGAQIIDYAKTGILAKTPSGIKNFLSKHKLPYFMGYKYPKEFTKEKRKNDTREIKGLTGVEQLNRYNCTVNYICWHLEEQFAGIDKDVSKKEKEESKDRKKTDFEWEKLLKIEDKINLHSKTIDTIRIMMKEFNIQHGKLSKYRKVTNPEDIDESNYKYKIFYDYVRNSLLSLCRVNVDVDKILDYLLIICYTDKKYVDKSILWNCFPDEMASRVKGEYFNDKNFDTNAFKIKADKAKKKIEKMNAANELVKVKLSIDQEERDKEGKIIQEKTKKISIDVTNIEVNVYQSEVDYIREAKLNKKQKSVLLVLLVIDRLHKSNKSRFFICPGKKNKITPSHICRLANINPLDYKPIMTHLCDKGFYLSPTGQTNLLVDINFMSPTVTGKGEEIPPIYTISDINNIQKCIKLLLTKVA